MVVLNKQFDMFDQLKNDDWYMVDMTEYQFKIFDIVTWCRDTLGPMLVIYDAGIRNCRWHGAQVDTYGAGVLMLFAFKDEADYTMLRLKFS